MEPLKPEVREELKRVHRGLTDDDIDRYEELTSLRFTLDPAEAPERIRDIDAERGAIVRERMPRFAEVENAILTRAARASREAKPEPEVRFRGPDDDTAT
jgi:hypothetical protein